MCLSKPVIYFRRLYWTDAELSSFIGVKDIDDLAAASASITTYSGLTHPYAIAIDFHSK